jgi:hypothetical protein
MPTKEEYAKIKSDPIKYEKYKAQQKKYNDTKRIEYYTHLKNNEPIKYNEMIEAFKKGLNFNYEEWYKKNIKI